MTYTFFASCDTIEDAERIAKRIKDNVKDIKSISILTPKKNRFSNSYLFSQPTNANIGTRYLPLGLGYNNINAVFSQSDLETANQTKSDFIEPNESTEVTIKVRLNENGVKAVNSILISGGALSIKKI